MERFQQFEIFTHPDGSLWELGRGAMGVTYRAKDTLLHREVALKVVNGKFLESDTARQRFQREARAAARISHENVAMVYQFGTEGDMNYYAMEYIRGESLDRHLNKHGAMEPVIAVRVAMQVCRALSAAEKEGLVHRDIKPANLMLMKGEDELRVKVIDFGLAKPTASAEQEATLTIAGFVGTPYFASPEQLEEKDVDIRSDIYSLGVTLWYMLAGSPPFAGSFANLVVQHLHSEPPLEKLTGAPPALRDVLSRALAKDPDERFQTPADFRNALQSCLIQTSGGTTHMRASAAPAPSPAPAGAESMETIVADTIVSAPPPTPQKASAPPIRTGSKAPLVAAGIIVLLAMAGGTAWMLAPKTQSAKEAPAIPMPIAKTEPASSPAPEPTPVTVPTPAPEPQISETDKLLEQARELEASDAPAAINSYLDIAQKYPGDPRAMRRMEGIFREWNTKAATLKDEASVEPSYKEAAAKAADAGVVDAMVFLGDTSKRTNPQLAAKWFFQASEKGNAHAMSQFALMIAKGAGDLELNPAKTMELLTKAEEAGDTPAKLYLANALMQKDGPFAPYANPAKGVQLLKEGAELGDAEAMFQLGIAYERGIGTTPDNFAAFQWYARAKDGGYWKAAANLGVFYLKGLGVEKNPVKAAEIFAEGANHKNPDCINFYGQCLQEGIGVKQDRTLAKQYFIEAARLGDERAIANCKALKIEY